MKFVFMSVLFFSVLFLTGCGIQPTPKIVYVQKKYPKQRVLRTVKTYEVTDIVMIDNRYCLQKRDLRKASKTSQLLRKQNFFYKSQAKAYNKKFFKKSNK